MKVTRDYRYRLVDVFSQVPFEGNQLAVFPDATGLDDATMQQIAREMNLPEITFVLPASLPGCLADVRIFTPNREMRFAGHPTIGTGAVLIDEGRVASAEFVFQERVGPVAVRVARDEGNLIWLRTPPIEWQRTYEPVSCAEALGLSPKDLMPPAPQRLSAGNPTLLICLRDWDAVDRASLSLEGMRNLTGPEGEPLCVLVFAVTSDGAYSRVFAPDYSGVSEDAATGSSTGPLAAYLVKHRLAGAAGAAGTRLISEQGVKMGRRSLLHIEIRGAGGSEGIDVGGHVTSIGEGKLNAHRAST
jgi:trans-2,3-dihydro-3-hydroxyanthranilate isomerase